MFVLSLEATPSASYKNKCDKSTRYVSISDNYKYIYRLSSVNRKGSDQAFSADEHGRYMNLNKTAIYCSENQNPLVLGRLSLQSKVLTS